MAIFTKEIHFKKHHFGYPSWFSGVYILYGSFALILQPLSPKKPLHCLLHDEKTSCLTAGLLGSHLGIVQKMQVGKAGDAFFPGVDSLASHPNHGCPQKQPGSLHFFFPEDWFQRPNPVVGTCAWESGCQMGVRDGAKNPAVLRFHFMVASHQPTKVGCLATCLKDLVSIEIEPK